MIKKNYIIKNKKSTEKIFNDLFKIYNKVEKIKKEDEDNVVGILFHELMYFFVSHNCRKNVKIFKNVKNNNPLIKFGKRNGKDIFELKDNSFLVLNFFKLYSSLIKLFNFEKKLFLSKSISLSLSEKIKIIFFSFIKRYELVLINFEDIKMNLSNDTFNFFLKEIKKLLIKNKLHLRNLKDVEILVNKIKTKKEFKFKNIKKSIIISGTLASIQNRLVGIKKKKLNAKLLTINHILTYGVVSYGALKFDEFYLCDYYLTPGKIRKIVNDKNYFGIDKNNYKILNIENKNKIYFSNTIKKINFKDLKKNKILYVPTRIVNVSLDGKNYLHKKDYESWQNFLTLKFGSIDAKFPYKKFDYKINNNFNILDTKLKLLEICGNYDLIIIDYISSTTFGEVASTNVPILYFNLNRDEINKDAKKIIDDRVSEIKVDIFNEFKGFNNFYKLKSKIKRKNKFKLTYLDSPIKKSIFKNLLDIDRDF